MQSHPIQVSGKGRHVITPTIHDGMSVTVTSIHLEAHVMTTKWRLVAVAGEGEEQKVELVHGTRSLAIGGPISGEAMGMFPSGYALALELDSDAEVGGVVNLYAG